MNAPVNVPAERRELAPIDVLKNTVARKANDFKMVLPSHISVDKFQRTIATAALSNRQLLDCDRTSLLIAAMKLAQDGLLPDGREAALVPFKVWNKDTRQTTWQVQAMPMAWGLRKKILQSGEVISLETGLVYLAELESGHFIYEIGMDPPIRHRPMLTISPEQTADECIVAAYSIARLKNPNGGDPYWSVEVMRRSEIDKVRQASQTGALGRTTRDGKPIPPKGPWVDWYGEMARKTVLRRHSKVLPMSGDIFETFDRDREEEIAADSAAGFLAHEPDAPITLPRGEDLDTQVGETVDHETGEVTQTDSRGLTEVDEATARQLDHIDPSVERAQMEAVVAQMARDFAKAKTDADKQSTHEFYAQAISDLEEHHPDLHEEAMALIPSYAEKGDEPLPEGAGQDPHRGEVWAERRREILDRFATVETADDLRAADEMLVRHLQAFPGEIQQELEKAASTARKIVNASKRG